MVLHLQRGFHLINKGKYKAAIDHFQDPKALKQMGITVKETPVWEMQIPGDVESAKQLVGQLARQKPLTAMVT